MVNLTEGYEVELYRNGMEVLFGLISISREHVMVPPGEWRASTGPSRPNETLTDRILP